LEGEDKRGGARFWFANGGQGGERGGWVQVGGKLSGNGKNIVGAEESVKRATKNSHVGGSAERP